MTGPANASQQPAEPEGSCFKEKIKLRATDAGVQRHRLRLYRARSPRRCCRSTTCCAWRTGSRTSRSRTINANWFNHVENIVDISHLAWLHGYTFPAYGGEKVTYHWERTDYGANNVMLVDGIADTHVSCYGFPTVNRFSLPPVEQSGELVRSMIYRVPADDASTLLYFVRFYPSQKRSFHSLASAR